MSQCWIEAVSGERSLACIGFDLEKMSALRTQTGTQRGENRRIAGQGDAKPDNKYIYVLSFLSFLIHSDMVRKMKRLPACFYRSEGGREPG